MPIQFGRTAYIALNEESTYGTANGSPFGVNNRVFSVSMGRSPVSYTHLRAHET